MRLGKYVELAVYHVPQFGNRQRAITQVDGKTELGGVIYLPRPGFHQRKHPAVFIVIGVVTYLLNIQLPCEQAGICDLQLVTDALGEKARETAINDALLFIAVAVPVNDLVRKALAAATYGITDPGRADTDTCLLYTSDAADDN